jgi:hypothetical protein
MGVEDYASEELFPSLSAMKPVTAGASWSQIRNRLTARTELNFKQTAESCIQREKEEREEGIRRELVTDPLEMTAEQRATNGWYALQVRSRPMNIIEQPTEEEIYNAKTDWGEVTLPGETDPRKIFSCEGSISINGDFERSGSPPPDYFAEIQEKPVEYSFRSDRNSKDRLLNFVKKKL